MRKAMLLLVALLPLSMQAKGMTIDELGEAINLAFAAQDFALFRATLLNANDVSHFLNLTTESEEYRQMTPDERYLVDAWIAEAKHTTRQEVEFQLYKLKQEFEKTLRKGADMYGIDWSAIRYEGVSYDNEIVSGVQKIRSDLRVTFISSGKRYDILLSGATFVDGGWKAQLESLRLVRRR